MRFIPALIFIGFVLGLGGIAAVGVTAYQRLKTSTDELRLAAQPNETLSNLKSILVDIANAETQVRTWGITRASADLTPYEALFDRIDQRFDSLLATEAIPQDELDTLREQVYMKFELLEEYILLRDDTRLTELLEELEETVPEHTARTTLQGDTPKKSVGQRIKRLFGSRSKELENQLAETRRQQAQTLETVESRVNLIRSERDRQQQAAVSAEMQLLQRSERISAGLQKAIQRIEANEKLHLNQQLRMAERRTEATIQEIGMVLLAGVVIMGLLAAIIFLAIRRAARYRDFLEIARQQAEVLAKAKESFANNLSHEVRAPLQTIISASAQLRQDYGADNRVEVIQFAAEASLDTMHAALDLAKLESGTATIVPEPVTLKALANELATLHQSAAQEKGLKWSLTVQPDHEGTLLVDKIKVRLAITNLIANAIKYTYEGGIDIVLSYDEGQILARVSDTGQGIPTDKQSAIFAAYDQAEYTPGLGAGLGLSLVRQIAELLGGYVRLLHSSEKGSTFEFSVPAKMDAEKPLVEEKLPLAGLCILAVDDEPFGLQLTAKILSDAGAEVTTASNAAAALELSTSLHPDVAILDKNMPDMPGEALAEELRAQIGATLPILFLTGLAEGWEAIGEQTWELAKPVEPSTLLQAVQTALVLVSK